MSVSDLIKERMKRKESSTEAKADDAARRRESTHIELEELSARVGDSGLKRLRIERQYEGRRTISASVPAWIKAALDYVAVASSNSEQGLYRGFGGKSRFIAEALAAKLKAEFPDVFEKLQRES